MVPDGPESPTHPAPVIRAWAGHAAVSRYTWVTPDELLIERAINWEALEADAIVAVTAQGGTLDADQTYPCPLELAARGWWPEEATTA
jgi:hypothetical protein